MAFPAKRQFYESLPPSVKSGVRLVPFSWMAGKAYRSVYARGGWFDRASRQELLEAQAAKLGEMLRFAVQQVPAYRHLRPVVDRHQPFEALQAFPLLDKETLQRNPHEYMPASFDRLKHYELSTGGTSGNQLKLYLDDHSHSTEMGFVHRFWEQMGYQPSARKATFRGVSFRALREGVFWQYNPIYNETQFSPFHMSGANLSAYVDEFVRIRPLYLHGYPSAIDMFAAHVLRLGMESEMPAIKAAFLTSEACSPMQRGRIERAFRTRVFSWYGHSERLIFAGECPHSTAYHHVPDYGVLELIDNGGANCEKEGERGELIGTGLNNRCLPLIRYRTGDYATRLDRHCVCGRNWDRFHQVEGRWKQDAIVGRNGTRISLTALNMHGPQFEHVVRFQFYQDMPGEVTLKLMVAPAFSEADRKVIAEAYSAKVGEEVHIGIQVVDDLPLTGRGKLKMLDSRLTAGK